MFSWDLGPHYFNLCLSLSPSLWGFFKTVLVDATTGLLLQSFLTLLYFLCLEYVSCGLPIKLHGLNSINLHLGSSFWWHGQLQVYEARSAHGYLTSRWPLVFYHFREASPWSRQSWFWFECILDQLLLGNITTAEFLPPMTHFHSTYMSPLDTNFVPDIFLWILTNWVPWNKALKKLLAGYWPKLMNLTRNLEILRHALE